MDGAEAQSVSAVVWWALLLGGAIGGLARTVVKGNVGLPYGYRDPITRQRIVVYGSIGEVFLGIVAALVFAGASAATFRFQTELIQGASGGRLLPASPSA
jgi:hypothetical protein